jgi:D-methionine transport system ATP-binding protein
MIYDIHATSLYKSYGGFTALSNINLKIKQGAIFGLIGTSGAGKSTLLKILTGLEKHDEGVLEIFGQKIPFDDKENLKVFRQKISVVFQNYQLLNSLTVFENIALPLELQNKDKKLISEKVDKLLQLVGLHQKKEAYPASLSGGQKQRVAIARALITDPKILFCDEPTSALDPENTAAVVKLLKDIRDALSTTIVIVTHEIGILGSLCDSLAIIDQGTLVESGNIHDVFFQPSHQATLKLLKPKSFKASDFFDKEESIPRIFELKFLGESAKKPLMSELVLLFNIHPNILEGHIEKVGKTSFGHLIVSFEDQQANLEKAIDYLQKHNVIIKEL